MLSLSEWAHNNHGLQDGQLISTLLAKRAAKLDQYNCAAWMTSAKKQFELIHQQTSTCGQWILRKEETQSDITTSSSSSSSLTDQWLDQFCLFPVLTQEYESSKNQALMAYQCSLTKFKEIQQQKSNGVPAVDRVVIFNQLLNHLECCNLMSKVLIFGNFQVEGARYAVEAAQLVEPDSYPELWYHAANLMRNPIGDYEKFINLTLTLAGKVINTHTCIYNCNGCSQLFDMYLLKKKRKKEPYLYHSLPIQIYI